jgi:DNA polymerase III delta subunit
MAKSTSASNSNLDPSMRVVVFCGAERFLIEECSRRFIESLDKAFGGVEQFTFDGQTVEPAAVLDELRSYGLMQKHKVVIVDDADVFLAGGRNAARAASSAANDDTDENDEQAEAAAEADAERASRRPAMERYLQSPVSDATLVMRAATWRKGNLDKLIQKHGTFVACEPLETARAAKWCIDRCQRRYEAAIDPDAADRLVHRVGTHMQRLDTELQKLAAMAGGASGKAPARITLQIVLENTSPSSEEKAWEIQRVVAGGSAGDMLRKLHELVDVSRQDAVPISWAVIDLLRKEHAAARLLEQRVSEQSIPGMLRLWGESIGQVMRVARRTPPDRLAQLLREAVISDQNSKSGVGEPVRNLETLMVKIADTTAAAG